MHVSFRPLRFSLPWQGVPLLSVVGMLLLAGSMTGCKQPDTNPAKASAESDTTTVRAGADSGDSVVDTAATNGTVDTLTNDEEHVPMQGQTETVVALYVREVGILPLALYADGSIQDLSPPEEKSEAYRSRTQELFARHPTYAIDVPPRIYSVDTVGTWRPAGANPFAGVGTVTKAVSVNLEGTRFRAGSFDRLAVSVSSGAKETLRRLIPTRDTTLTAAQRQVLADTVARRLVGEETEGKKIDEQKWKTVAQHASARLKPEADSATDLTLDVTSGDFDGDGSVEYMVAGERTFEKVLRTLSVEEKKDSSKAQFNFEMFCNASPKGGEIVESPVDSLAQACVDTREQVIVAVGRMKGERWTELTFSVWPGRESGSPSLQVMNVNGTGAPELLIEIGGSGYQEWRLIGYEDESLSEIARFGHGS